MPFYQMGWLLITIIAYFFHAFAVVLDKFLLGHRIQRPSTYAFWVAAFGLGVLILAPFDFYVPPTSAVINAFISGSAFTLALFFFYIAIQAGEASRVTPFIGALSPIFVFILSHGLLGETLNKGEFAAFIVLVLGSILISFTVRRDGRRIDNGDLRVFGWAVLASFFFGVTYVYEKAVFNEVSFINGFIWTRFGGFFGALPFLVFSHTRYDIFAAPRMVDWTTVAAFLTNKLSGAAGFFLLSFAISIGPSVSLINALQGIEYVLVFVMALFLSRFRPSILEEEFTPLAILEKIIAIILIGVGLALLAFFGR